MPLSHTHWGFYSPICVILSSGGSRVWELILESDLEIAVMDSKSFMTIGAQTSYILNC